MFDFLDWTKEYLMKHAMMNLGLNLLKKSLRILKRIIHGSYFLDAKTKVLDKQNGILGTKWMRKENLQGKKYDLYIKFIHNRKLYILIEKISL